MKRTGKIILIAGILLILGINVFCCSRREPGKINIEKSATPDSLKKTPLKPAGTSDDSGELPTAIINPIDGAEMVLIPEGWFFMGYGNDTNSNYGPRRKVYTGAFYIYKYEVTNRQFKKFVQQTGYKTEGPWDDEEVPAEYDNHPAVRVTFGDASAYCRWAKVTLPTEAQWEKAARGTDGRIYPWGNRWKNGFCNNADTASSSYAGFMRPLMNGKGTLPAGYVKTDISPFGVMDMAGNINEWCLDYYQADYFKDSPEKNPEGPAVEGPERVLKGGGWSLEPLRCRCFTRWSGDEESPLGDYGFRCAAGWSFAKQ